MRRPTPLLLALACAACAARQPGPGPLPDGLDGTSWRAEAISGLAPLPGVTSTLTFLAPDRVGGSTGCNRFSGPLAVERGRLRLGPLISTKMACPPAVMEQERRFTTALAQAARFERDGAALLLHAAGREAPTRFVPTS